MGEKTCPKTFRDYTRDRGPRRRYVRKERESQNPFLTEGTKRLGTHNDGGKNDGNLSALPTGRLPVVSYWFNGVFTLILYFGLLEPKSLLLGKGVYFVFFSSGRKKGTGYLLKRIIMVDTFSRYFLIIPIFFSSGRQFLSGKTIFKKSTPLCYRKQSP